MENNYEYFLAIAETLNISKAAEKLSVSHQCLSHYLKNLESCYKTKFFYRRPKFSLTPAGTIMLEKLKRIEAIDKSLADELKELSSGGSGEIRIGTTEGRLRILLPNLLDYFKMKYPHIKLRITSAKTSDLIPMLENAKLDFAIVGLPRIPLPDLARETTLQERLFLVISDNMLEEYFPDSYPECKKKFLREGADLHQFTKVPFALNYRGFNSRDILDRYLVKENISLTCINETTAMDLHHIMSARDYAASIALTMYLPSIQQLNENQMAYSHINVFPIKGLTETNPIVILYVKNRYLPSYIKDTMKITKNICNSYNETAE